MNLVITVAVFIAVLCILEGIILMLKSRWDPEARRVQRQLKTLSYEAENPENHQGYGYHPEAGTQLHPVAPHHARAYTSSLQDRQPAHPV